MNYCMSPKGLGAADAYPSLGGEFAQPKTTSHRNSEAVAFGKGGYKKHLILESKMNKFTIALRALELVGVEPRTFCLQRRCSTN